MKTKLSMLVAFILSVSIATSVFGQEAPKVQEMKKVGFGLHVEQFKTQDIMSSTIVAANKLLITLNPASNFRVEPSVGFSKFKDEFGDNLNGGSETSKGVYLGIGAFYMYQAGKTNLYFGLRLEHGKITEEREYSGSGYSEKNTTKTKRFMFAPTLGAEYFLGKHFSFGGEFALKNYSSTSSYTNSNNSPPSDENKNKYFSTDTGLLLRFYF